MCGLTVPNVVSKNTLTEIKGIHFIFVRTYVNVQL